MAVRARLPPCPAVGNYVMAARSGRLLISTGHVPVDGDRVVRGKLGRDLTTDEGYQAARLAVGVSSLPGGVAVEIQVVAEVADGAPRG